MTILYEYGGKLYINVTNRCSCNCTFCIRQNGNTVGDSGSLWLEHEPSFEEIVQAFEAADTTCFSEVVFCGYGEPLERLDTVLQTCRYLRRISKLKIRLNTNGLSDLINSKPTAHLLKGLVDTVSISLNASNSKEYESICRPSFGEVSFPAMLQFAQDCKQSIERVIFSVVDVIPKQEIEACQKLADEMGIPLRIRAYEG